MVELECFFSKIGRKLGGMHFFLIDKNTHVHFFLIDKNGHVQVHMGFVWLPFFKLFFKFFIFIFYRLGVIVVFFFFFWTWFFINKFGWLLFFFFFGSLFCFNWVLFFNKGIWVNLFKLIFSIPPLFYSQPNKNEKN